MINNQTMLKVCDNSGVKSAKCFNLPFYCSYKNIGIVFFLIVNEVKHNIKLQKGLVSKGILIRRKKMFNRLTGNYLFFNSNDVILINDKNELLGTRIFGPLLLELRKKQKIKLLSLSTKIL